MDVLNLNKMIDIIIINKKRFGTYMLKNVNLGQDVLQPHTCFGWVVVLVGLFLILDNTYLVYRVNV